MGMKSDLLLWVQNISSVFKKKVDLRNMMLVANLGW